jgi:predicted component of type VI protein secretion system
MQSIADALPAAYSETADQNRSEVPALAVPQSIPSGSCDSIVERRDPTDTRYTARERESENRVVELESP